MWPFGDGSSKGPSNDNSTITPQAEVPISKPRILDERLPKPEKLPKGLQDLVDEADKDESFYDELWGGT